jgi:hypothetical protein
MALLFVRFIRLVGATALVTDLTFALELLAQHLSLFLELTAAGRTTFAFVIASFFAGRFPALEHSGHNIWLGINLYFQDSRKIQNVPSPLNEWKSTLLTSLKPTPWQ